MKADLKKVVPALGTVLLAAQAVLEEDTGGSVSLVLLADADGGAGCVTNLPPQELKELLEGVLMKVNLALAPAPVGVPLQ
jgi:hypothetical protein